MRRRRRHLRPVDRDDADLDQPAARAESEHLPEQLGQRVLMALPEARDRRVVRPLLAVITRNATSSGTPARSPATTASRSRRRRATARPSSPGHRPPGPPVDPISRVEPIEVHLADRVEHKPREVTLRQPLTDSGGIRQRLLAITRDKAQRHAPDRLETARTAPDLRDTLRRKRQRAGHRLRRPGLRRCRRRTVVAQAPRCASG